MTSTFVLAVDIGTSRTAASTARVDSEGTVETASFALGRHADTTPSAVFVSDGDLLFGEAAERRGVAQPDRLIREFKRRIGDDVPLMVGGRDYLPEHLFARTVSWVADAVAEREGRQPEAIVVTVPVTWGDYRRALVTAALAREVVCPVELVEEPVAAAWHYTASSALAPDRVLAVYDLGGGTFDVALVGSDADGTLRITGAPTGIADFGGADFDDLVLRHAISAAGLTDADLAGRPDALVALAALRRECVEAKEALSFDSEAAIPVFLAGTTTTVRLTRAEFERLIEPGIERTIDLLQSALEKSDVGDRLEGILLTGGSSRIPRVAQLLSERCDAPIAVDADPKAIVALGAARIMAHRLYHRQAAAAAPATDAAALATGDALALTGAAADAPIVAEGSAEQVARRRWFRRLPATAALAAGSLVLASGIVLAGATELGNGSRASTEYTGVDTFAEWLGVRLGDGSAAAAETDASGSTTPPSNGVAPPTAGTAPETSSPNPRQRVAERGTQARAEEAAAEQPRTGSSSTPPRTGSGGTAGTGGQQQTPGDAEPDPEPTTGPDPDPDPTPDPEPTVDPQPEPTPDPEPTTDPQPEPTPDPQPTTDPQPSPDPEPPAPEPTPEPPAPEPEPTPDPEPTPLATTVPEPT